MKKKTTIVLLILTLSIYSSNINVQITAEENNYLPTSLELTPNDSIDIRYNSDFEVFPGSGTEENPYVIEGYNITTASDRGISITVTTYHFVIIDCYIDAGSYGIYIGNVANGTTSITNTTCTNNNYGIYLSSSSGTTLTNNTCTNNINYGIWLSSSSGATLTNNICTNNGHGILLDSSSSSTLTNNTCTNNNYYGILLIDSDFCIITYNFLQENGGYGIYLHRSRYYNRVSSDNLIYHNIFVDNNLGGTSQAYDDGTNNKWYDPETKEGNYWSDLGNRCTYKIEGKAHSKDLYPLNRAQSCPNPITMTILSIVLPLLVSAAILAFLIPKYIIPYTRKYVIPFICKRWKLFLVLVAGIIGFIPSLYFVLYYAPTESFWYSIWLSPQTVLFGILILVAIPKLVVAIKKERRIK